MRSKNYLPQIAVEQDLLHHVLFLIYTCNAKNTQLTETEKAVAAKLQRHTPHSKDDPVNTKLQRHTPHSKDDPAKLLCRP